MVGFWRNHMWNHLKPWIWCDICHYTWPRSIRRSYWSAGRCCPRCFCRCGEGWELISKSEIDTIELTTDYCKQVLPEFGYSKTDADFEVCHDGNGNCHPIHTSKSRIMSAYGILPLVPLYWVGVCTRLLLLDALCWDGFASFELSDKPNKKLVQTGSSFCRKCLGDLGRLFFEHESLPGLSKRFSPEIWQ